MTTKTIEDLYERIARLERESGIYKGCLENFSENHSGLSSNAYSAVAIALRSGKEARNDK